MKHLKKVTILAVAILVCQTAVTQAADYERIRRRKDAQAIRYARRENPERYRRYDRRPNSYRNTSVARKDKYNYNYNYNYNRYDHRHKIEVKRPHRDLYTALDVINTVANVVDAFTPNTPQVVHTETQTVIPTQAYPSYAPTVQYETPTAYPTYQSYAPVQPQVVQPTYTQPTVMDPTFSQPVQPENPAVSQPVYTQSTYAPPVQAPVVQPVVVNPTPVVVPQPVVTTPPAMVVQPPVQNTTIVVPPCNPFGRRYLPPRYYNRPYYPYPRNYWR